MNTTHAPIEKSTTFGIIATAAAGLVLAAVAIPAVIGSPSSDEQPRQVGGTSVTAGSSTSSDDLGDRAALIRRISDILATRPDAVPVVAPPGTTAGRAGSGATGVTTTWPTGSAQAPAASTTTCGSPTCTWTAPASTGTTTTPTGSSAGGTTGTTGASSSGTPAGGTPGIVTGTTAPVTTTIDVVVNGVTGLLGG